MQYKVKIKSLDVAASRRHKSLVMEYDIYSPKADLTGQSFLVLTNYDYTEDIYFYAKADDVVVKLGKKKRRVRKGLKKASRLCHRVLKKKKQ